LFERFLPLAGRLAASAPTDASQLTPQDTTDDHATMQQEISGKG
jgi:hypothetical protein